MKDVDISADDNNIYSISHQVAARNTRTLGHPELGAINKITIRIRKSLQFKVSGIIISNQFLELNISLHLEFPSQNCENVSHPFEKWPYTLETAIYRRHPPGTRYYNLKKK